MENPESHSPELSNDDGAAMKGTAAVVGLVLCMIASIFYQYPTGKSIGLGGFIMLWFREILILAIPAIALVVVAIVKLWQFLSRRGPNAH
jgi:hypothetical protein